jgi:hypothetical protein
VLAVLDDGLSRFDDLSEIRGAVLDVTDLGELAVFLGRSDVNLDLLDILEELGEVGLARLDLGDDVLDVDNHVLDIMDAVLDVLGIDWHLELAVLLGSSNIGGDLLGILQDLGKVRRARFGLSDDVLT